MTCSFTATGRTIDKDSATPQGTSGSATAAFVKWLHVSTMVYILMSINCDTNYDKRVYRRRSLCRRFIFKRVSIGAWMLEKCNICLLCDQWLKWFCEAGRLTWRSQVGANPIPIPTPTNLALFRHKITLYRFNQGAHTIAGDSIGSRGLSPPPPRAPPLCAICSGCYRSLLNDDSITFSKNHHISYAETWCSGLTTFSVTFDSYRYLLRRFKISNNSTLYLSGSTHCAESMWKDQRRKPWGERGGHVPPEFGVGDANV